jgi:hypothetical protein
MGSDRTPNQQKEPGYSDGSKVSAHRIHDQRKRTSKRPSGDLANVNITIESYLTECGPMCPVAVEHVIVRDKTGLDPRRAIYAETD